MQNDIPYTVVDATGYVMSQSASLERAKDVKWGIENEGWPYKFTQPLSIVKTIPWDQGAYPCHLE